MQVPATAAPGAHNVTDGVSSSLVETLSGCSAVKGKQAAPFAAILAEQSPSVSSLKDKDVLPGAGMKSKDVLIATLQQPRAIESVFSDLQSDGAMPVKDKTETGHRKNAPTSSDHPGKKQQAIAASDSALLSTVMAPVPLVAAPPAPVVMEKGSHFTAKTSLNHLLTAQIALTAHDQKFESQILEPSAAVSSELSKPEETLSLAADPVPHEIQPDSIPSAKSHPVPSPSAIANVDQARVQVAQAHNPEQTLLNVSPLTDSSHGVNGAAVSHAEPVAQSTVAPSATVASQKPKLQNKTSDVAVNKLDKLSGSGAAPMAGLASSSGDSLTTASSPHAATGNLSPRPETAFTEANAYQHLDAGESPVTLLHSSTHEVAVGVHDPSLGWVEVQTQSSAGHISATLTTASLEAHASLAAQASTITQYLADRNVSVHSVNVHTQTGIQNGGPGSGQPQSGSGGAYQGPHEPRNVGARVSSRPLLNEMGNGNMPQALNASRISVHA